MFNLKLTKMELQDKIGLYKELMERFGYENQMLVAVEEMAELTNALTKERSGRATRADVVTEIADVIICCEQLAMHFGLEDVLKERDQKLDRQRARLDGGAMGDGGADACGKVAAMHGRDDNRIV